MKSDIAKQVSRMVVDLHRQFGVCAVRIDGYVPPPPKTQLTLFGETEEDFLVKKGRDLRTKDVRGYLWKMRKPIEEFTEEAGVVWSHYDEETDQSLVGLCILPEQEIEVK